MSHQPIDVIQSFYDAIAAGNATAVLSLLHDDLRWTEAEGFPYYSGTWRQPQEVIDKLLIPLARDWTSFTAKADDFITDGQRVISLGIYTGTVKATGQFMRAPFAHLWRVCEGKITHFDMYTDTLLVSRALYGDEPASTL